MIYHRVYPITGTHKAPCFPACWKRYTLHTLFFFCICTSPYIYPQDVLVVLEKHARSCGVLMSSGD